MCRYNHGVYSSPFECLMFYRVLEQGGNESVNGVLAMRHLFTLAIVYCSFSLLHAAESAKDAPSQQTPLEQSLADQLSGASLVGTYTSDGTDEKSADRYQIVSVQKQQGENWLVTYKAVIGNRSLDIPIPLKIVWAGDTPVMTLTELTIPGLGTFTARVMFFGDRYAGTWQHGHVGGHMWGKIEKPITTNSKP